MLPRIFSVLAAFFLVGSVALAALSPRGLTLGQGLLTLGHQIYPTLQAGLGRPAWLWQGLVLPLLMRPVWLVPAAIGIVCGGVALSVTWLKVPTHTRRRS